jgi:DNA polymerase
MLVAAMTPSQRQRVLRQHVQTDALFGVDAVPAGQGAAAADEATGAAPPAAASGGSPAVQLDRQTKLARLKEMDENEVRPCTKCDLCRGRTQTVFGEGDLDAQLMFVGEGPGQREDELGRPFVGRAGDLLDKQIAAMGFQREQVFIANIVKCRPPDNRTPTPDEVRACSPYLQRQIATIGPKVIVALGAPATKFLLSTTTGIMKLRGTWHQYEGLLPDGPTVPVMPTFHPAFLLRQYTTDNRQKVWSDLQQVMEVLGE